jgi:site-specific DNA-methyltransferase (adenine-specific)
MDWQTPPDIFNALNMRFHFTLDAAASPHNAKCPRYFTIVDDGLSQSWANERVFCNPPYGRDLPKWARKAYEESQSAELIVLLIPARTDTAYFHDYIWHKAQIEFIRGCIRFLDEYGKKRDSAPFPSMLAIYRNDQY